MSGAFFYIEYRSGKITEIKFKTAKMAKKAYELYDKEPEDNAKGWGWEIKCEPLTLSQQIRARKINEICKK